MKNTLTQKTVENEIDFYNVGNWKCEIELLWELDSLKEKLKKAQAKIRMQNKIIEALTK